MALVMSEGSDLMQDLGLTGDDLLTSSSSEEDICDEIPSAHHSFTIDQGPEFQDLKKVLKQTQSELRLAQNNLIQSECGRENRLKILRKAHLSALALKQSLIQELQDIITEKDEYIVQLENRLSGRQPNSEAVKDKGLTKLVDQYSRLSKEFVDLKSQHELTLQDLHDQRMRQPISDPALIEDVKKLRLKLKSFDGEHQELLLLRRSSKVLLNEVEVLKGKISTAETKLAQTTKVVCIGCKKLTEQVQCLKEQLQSNSEEFHEVKTALNSDCSRLKEILEESNKKARTALNSDCTRLKEMLQESNKKTRHLTNTISALENTLQTQKLHIDVLEDKCCQQYRPPEYLSPTIMKISRSVYDIREDIRALSSTVAGFSDTMFQEFSQIAQKLCGTIFDFHERSNVMKQKYLSEMKQRKRLHNELIELKGNIRVFCRVRPVITEDGSGSDASVVVDSDVDDDSLVHIHNRGSVKTFEVDKVFGPNSTQQEVFGEVEPLITSCIDGYNVCIFAYGQTGSGKTFTMEGPAENPGINQRALHKLFAKVDSCVSEWRYSILVSMLEIYNESIRDLLSSNRENKLDIRLNTDGLYIPGLTQVSVSNLDEVNMVLSLGHKNRSTASTRMNISSSRSHALLSVSVMGHNTISGVKTFGKLNLVDLAGSERLHKSGSDGARLQEAKHINKSLSSLADVIYSLRTKSRHIPYRNSKLTYLLQDSLGKDSKTLMVVQLSPILKNSSETFCSLNFAQRVRAVELNMIAK